MRMIERISGAVAIIIVLALGGCSDLKNQLPNPVTPASVVHNTGWVDSSGHGAGHGAALKQLQWNSTSCKSCHGGSYSGGTSQVSCYTCHAAAPHEIPFGTAANGHGLYVKAKQWNSTECKLCHGSTYDNGNVPVTCYSCHNAFPHEVKFSTTAGGHQGYLRTAGYKNTECQQCHGAVYDGGAAGVSCVKCHAAYPHEVAFTSGITGHKTYIASKGYLTTTCKDCHGTDYAGGTVSVNCSSSQCHATAAGVAKSPEACNTCHGQFRAAANDTASWAPARAVNGDSLTSNPGVGAHQAHLRGNGTSPGKLVPCATCHVVPSTVASSGHFDAGALVHFSGLALKSTSGIVPNPSFSTSSNQCSNTYCHGNWKLTKAGTEWIAMYSDTAMTGASASPLWTGGANQGKCESCHGMPPVGHRVYPTYTCAACHDDVVDDNNNIIDKTKHINGKINVFSKEYDFR